MYLFKDKLILLDAVCQWLTEKDHELFDEALSVVGSIMTTEEHIVLVDRLCYNDVANKMLGITSDPRVLIVKKVCWAYSNLAACG